MYRLVIKRSATKELDAIPKEQFSRIDKAILSLKEDPYSHPASKKLKGEDKRRLRAGDYRVIYSVDEAVRVVTVY